MVKTALTTTAAAAALACGMPAGATANPEMTTGATQQRVEAAFPATEIRDDAVARMGEVMEIKVEEQPIYSIVPWFVHGRDYNPQQQGTPLEERMAEVVPWYLTDVE